MGESVSSRRRGPGFPLFPFLFFLSLFPFVFVFFSFRLNARMPFHAREEGRGDGGELGRGGGRGVRGYLTNFTLTRE